MKREECVRETLNKYLDGRTDREGCERGEEGCDTYKERLQIVEEEEETLEGEWRERQSIHESV